jgi:hypothetical protein
LENDRLDAFEVERMRNGVMHRSPGKPARAEARRGWI